MENNGIGKLFEGVDRWTVLIYVLIVLVGFVAILSASYEEGRSEEHTSELQSHA